MVTEALKEPPSASGSIFKRALHAPMAVTRPNVVIVPRRAIRPKGMQEAPSGSTTEASGSTAEASNSTAVASGGTEEATISSTTEAHCNAAAAPDVTAPGVSSGTAEPPNVAVTSSTMLQPTAIARCLPCAVPLATQPTPTPSSKPSGVTTPPANPQRRSLGARKAPGRGTILLDTLPRTPPRGAIPAAAAAAAAAERPAADAAGQRAGLVVIRGDPSSRNASTRERQRLAVTEAIANEYLVDSQRSEREGDDDEDEGPEEAADHQSPSSEAPGACGGGPQAAAIASPAPGEGRRPPSQQAAACVVTECENVSGSDDDDDEEDGLSPAAPYLSAPPRNFRLQISSFGELWSVVSTWVTAESIDYLTLESDEEAEEAARGPPGAALRTASTSPCSEQLLSAALSVGGALQLSDQARVDGKAALAVLATVLSFPRESTVAITQQQWGLLALASLRALSTRRLPSLGTSVSEPGKVQVRCCFLALGFALDAAQVLLGALCSPTDLPVLHTHSVYWQTWDFPRTTCSPWRMCWSGLTRLF